MWAFFCKDQRFPHPQPQPAHTTQFTCLRIVQGTLWRAIWEVHRGTLGWTALFRLGVNVTAWASPLLLQQLLEQLSGDRHPGDGFALLKLHIYTCLWSPL